MKNKTPKKLMKIKREKLHLSRTKKKLKKVCFPKLKKNSVGEKPSKQLISPTSIEKTSVNSLFSAVQIFLTQILHF